MNVIVTYDSYFINTRKIAEAVAAALESRGAQVHLERIYQLDFASLSGVDLLIVGSPTHNRGMPRPIKSVLKRLPRESLQGVKIATFDTRYRMSARKSGSAAQGIDRLLRRLGAEQQLPPESFFVQERRGPLFAGELERAETWITSQLPGKRRS
jgi:flavodoxin